MSGLRGLMNDDDWAMVQDDLARIRADNAATMTILTRTTTPPAQQVRIVGAGQQGRVLVAGDASLDVQRGDEFFHAGHRYRIEFVKPNQRVRKTAVAEVLQ